jgi:4-alpha-glucanotransferase
VADRWGIEPGYVDGEGRWREVPAATSDALREAMGSGDEEVGPPLVVRAGMEEAGTQEAGTQEAGTKGPSIGPGTILLEDGGEVPCTDLLPADVPPGYHTLVGAEGERSLIVTPGRCSQPRGRSWGWAVQLYAARSARSWGIGDLADLRALARWARGLGAGMLLVSPLGAAAPTLPQQPSPYFPSSRRFRNPIHLSVEDVAPGREASGLDDLADLSRLGRCLTTDQPIDRDGVWRLKLSALESIWSARRVDDGFEPWLARQGAALTEFATWCALAEVHGPRWRDWPARYHRPRGAAVRGFAAERADRVRFHQWLQWLLEGQLVAAGTELDLIGDVPVGIDPDGADAWAWQDLLAWGATIGAPPDQFNPAGQDWGLPPFVPHRLAAARYEPFVETIRAALHGFAGLRVDHVMGLFRLFWVPAGRGPAEGAYVRYPAEDLLGILALESHRAEAPVVGEDLGTVEPGVREALAAYGILSYRVLWFEAEDPAGWPALSMASVTTHDLPTVAGLWSGTDLQELERLGVGTDRDETAAIRARLAVSGGVEPGAADEDAVLAAHRLLARSPSLWLCGSLEDAVAQRRRPNVPAALGRPQWSLPLPVSIDDLHGHSLAQLVAAILDGAVRHGAVQG